MDVFWFYVLQLIVTLGLSLFVYGYLRPQLRRLLIDLCGTQERAEFWVVFSGIVLVGLPLIIGVGYNPLNGDSGVWFYNAARQVRANLLGMLVVLIGMGFVVSFFTLFVPRQMVK